MSEPKHEKSQDKKSFPERLGIWLNSWSGVMVAATVLIGALVGLYIGGVNAWHAIHHPAARPTPSHTIITTSPAHRSSSPPVRVSSSPPTPEHSPLSGPSPTPPGRPGTEIDSGTVALLNGNALTYQTGASNEAIFYYYGSLGDLAPGNGVNLALLNAPAPASNDSYQACEGVSSSSSTQDVPINSIAPGETLCAFIPNNQVAWVQFLGTTQSEQSQMDLTLHVSAIIWQGPSS